jgi:hypothetical protein
VTGDDRQELAKAARERFEQASADIAAEERFPGTHGMTEIELLEYATRLQKAARKK